MHETIRKKDDRKKLHGFSCYDCEDYYNSKLSEGFTEDQVKKLMNDCSKHRSKFKPSRTPEQFWDPEIIEGDPDSPRNKTQIQTEPFDTWERRRARRKKEKEEQSKEY